MFDIINIQGLLISVIRKTLSTFWVQVIILGE